jgi:hypothetical protein
MTSKSGENVCARKRPPIVIRTSGPVIELRGLTAGASRDQGIVPSRGWRTAHRVQERAVAAVVFEEGEDSSADRLHTEGRRREEEEHSLVE